MSWYFCRACQVYGGGDRCWSCASVDLATDGPEVDVFTYDGPDVSLTASIVVFDDAGRPSPDQPITVITSS